VGDSYTLNDSVDELWRGGLTSLRVGYQFDGSQYREIMSYMKFNIRYPFGLKEIINTILYLKTKNWHNASLPFDINISLVDNNWDDYGLNPTVIGGITTNYDKIN